MPSQDPDLMYTTEQAIQLAELWRAGKTIGGDENDVIFALLAEVERLREERRRIARSLGFMQPDGTEDLAAQAERYRASSTIKGDLRLTESATRKLAAATSLADYRVDPMTGPLPEPPCR